jgi:tRNA-guanine transglycosylase
MFFDITHKEKYTRARTGILHTDHGDIETPAFMPVGTQASVKTLDTRDIKSVGADIILANTYHLHLRPGEDLIEAAGGLHRFMQWNGPILTDSGGFQVLSLGAQMDKTEHTKLVDIDEDGVTFRSHIDGSTHRFTPEIAIDIQHKLGADIIMAFDECTPDDADKTYTKEAMERTHRWAKRCIAEHKKNTNYHGYKQFLFGIIQGATHKELRIASAKAISAMDFDGIAIGGESIGYNMEATRNILDWVIPLIPEEKPHYAMGVGFSPTDLFDVVERGIDMFDCVAPTRIARSGSLYVKDDKNNFRLNILNARFKTDMNPIDPACDCFTCQTHTKSYLHHLFKASELLAYRLATIHNLHFLLSLMKNIREAIREDTFLDLKKEWTKKR